MFRHAFSSLTYVSPPIHRIYWSTFSELHKSTTSTSRTTEDSTGRFEAFCNQSAGRSKNMPRTVDNCKNLPKLKSNKR